MGLPHQKICHPAQMSMCMGFHHLAGETVLGISMTEKNCNSHLHWLLLPMHMPNILCSAENRMLKVSNGTCISSQQFASQIIFNPKGQRLNPLNNLVD